MLLILFLHSMEMRFILFFVYRQYRGAVTLAMLSPAPMVNFGHPFIVRRCVSSYSLYTGSIEVRSHSPCLALCQWLTSVIRSRKGRWSHYSTASQYTHAQCEPNQNKSQRWSRHRQMLNFLLQALWPLQLGFELPWTWTRKESVEKFGWSHGWPGNQRMSPITSSTWCAWKMLVVSSLKKV